MQATLKIRLEHRTAAMSAQVAIILMRRGFRIERQSYQPIAETAEAWLTLTVAGKTAADTELANAVSSLPGILAVELQSSEAEPRLAPGDGQELQAVVMLILAEYPDIAPTLRSFEGDLEGELRAPLMFNLGVSSGAALSREELNANAPAKSLSDILQHRVGRILKPVAGPIVRHGSVDLRECPFARSSTDGIGCSFFTGLIKGVVEAAPAGPQVKVTKTACRTQRGPHCRFQVLEPGTVSTG